ncbi:MAG: hypothetical protein Q9167_007820 [Letrouitia subvulpina]
MLPSFLFDSYKQYKTDSDAVATWLANTARQHGYPEDLLGESEALQQSQQKTPRLKGRARKLAREAAQNKSPNSSIAGQKPVNELKAPKYLIALKDFISLAEWIAAKMRAEVPPDFLRVLDRAIAVRKRHHDWWYCHNRRDASIDGQDEQANKGHGYFISVLERVRKILRSKMPIEFLKDPLAQPGDSPDEARLGNVPNLFENLNIEEPSEAFLISKPALTTQQSTQALSQYQYGLQTNSDPEEVQFAIHCLFNDLNNLRRYLQQVWDGYKQGAFDLVAVSITTNTAIDFAKQFEENFTTRFPDHVNFASYIEAFYIQLCLDNGRHPGVKEYPDDEMVFAVYDEAESILFPAYMLMSSFSDVVKPGILPSYKLGYFGVYDASSDRRSKSARDKFREDKILMMEVLPDFCAFAQRPGRNPAEDGITRGMREMIKQNKVHVWLAFAAQIFLDISHILRVEASRGFSDLVRSAKYVETNIELVLKFHEKLRIQNWPRQNDQVLIQILDLIKEWVKTDAVNKIRTIIMKRNNLTPPPTEPFVFLKRHPLYCGLLTYNIKYLAQEASIIFANAWGSIMYCAHLYNALHQEQLISTSWQDMDLALLMHRTKEMFIGDFPKTIKDYFSRFSLAMGCSASNFAKNRRQEDVISSKAGPRKLNFVCPVSAIFQARYCGNEPTAHFSPEDIEAIFQGGTDDDEDDTDSNDEESNEWSSPKIKISATIEEPSLSPFTSSQACRPQKSHMESSKTGVRPVELLNALLNAIQTETLYLSFNHFRLHTFCWRLLRALKESLDLDLRKYYGPRYLENENQLPFIVGYIFMTAVETKRLGKMLAPKKEDVVSNQLLIKAGEVLQEMLDCGAGRIELEMLKRGLGFEVEVVDVFAVKGRQDKTTPPS